MFDWLKKRRGQLMVQSTDRDVELHRLGRLDAYIRRKQMQGSTAYNNARIEYVRSYLTLQREIMALDDIQIDRELQQERFKHIDDFVREQTNEILAKVKESETRYKDAVSHESVRVWGRKTEEQKAKDNYESYMTSRNGSPSVEAPQEKKNPLDLQLEEEFEREWQMASKTDQARQELKDRLDEIYNRKYGGYQSAPPEMQREYDHKLAAFDRLAKRYHRA